MTKQEARQQAIRRHLENTKDCGRFGRAFELECARIKSNKTEVSEQNETDVFIKYITEDGKAKYLPAEAKTNGGRVDELLSKPKVKYVIYKMTFVQKHKASKSREAWDELREIAPVIIPVDLFVAKLKEFNAIKAINRGGKLDGYGIQVSSKKWYEWLSEYPVEFSPEYEFEGWMFEGLE